MKTLIPTILHIAVDTPLRFALDYYPPELSLTATIKPGMRIEVPFRKKSKIGVVMGLSDKTELTNATIKTALAVLDHEPLIPDAILQLIHFASEYYHHPIGEVVAAALPKAVRQGKSIDLPSKRSKGTTIAQPQTTAIELNTEQQQAVTAICSDIDQFHTYLLDGVTGSGKTEVYFQAIEHLLRQNKQVLVLVPEIGLTPQTIARFQHRFDNTMVAYHSGLTDKQRLEAWAMAQSAEAKIVIGTRSAIFMPMPRLGMIIIDEEHDPSYKQQDGFRYNARDLAIIRAKNANINIVLGSATPSLESLYNVRQGRYQQLRLQERAGKAIMPRFTIVDMQQQHNGISTQAIQAMHRHLDAGNQALLFLNRRGFAPHLICHECRTVLQCRRCDTNLVLHQSPQQLICHHCGYCMAMTKQCPSCQAGQLLPLGYGTERIESLLTTEFAKFHAVRIDRDSVRRKGAMQAKLAEIDQGLGQILIGTQMLAKGHHFPNITLVIILDADSGFLSSELKAVERIGQLLMQVSGRAGRADKPGEVLIQTRQPNNRLLHCLLHQGYHAFAEQLLQERQQAQLPPFAHMALLRAEDFTKAKALQFLEQIKDQMAAQADSSLTIMGPIPAPIERKAGRYRAQLLFHAAQRRQLHHFLTQLTDLLDKSKDARKVRWSLDVDPHELS